MQPKLRRRRHLSFHSLKWRVYYSTWLSLATNAVECHDTETSQQPNCIYDSFLGNSNIHLTVLWRWLPSYYFSGVARMANCQLIVSHWWQIFQTAITLISGYCRHLKHLSLFFFFIFGFFGQGGNILKLPYYMFGKWQGYKPR